MTIGWILMVSFMEAVCFRILTSLQIGRVKSHMDENRQRVRVRSSA